MLIAKCSFFFFSRLFFLSFFSFFLFLPLPLHDSRLFTCSPTSNRHARVGAYTQQSARFPFQNFTPRPFSPPRHRQFRTCNGRVACHSIAHACWNPHTHVRAARNQRDCVCEHPSPRPLGAHDSPKQARHFCAREREDWCSRTVNDLATRPLLQSIAPFLSRASRFPFLFDREFCKFSVLQVSRFLGYGRKRSRSN